MPTIEKSIDVRVPVSVADEGQVEEDLERFRELVENRETPTGEWRGRVDAGRVIEDNAR